MTVNAWMQGPSNAFNDSVNLTELRERLARMSDDELVKFGRQMRGLAFPRRVMYNGKPCAFEIQYGEAREEWRRRKRIG